MRTAGSRSWTRLLGGTRSTTGSRRRDRKRPHRRSGPARTSDCSRGRRAPPRTACRCLGGPSPSDIAPAPGRWMLLGRLARSRSAAACQAPGCRSSRPDMRGSPPRPSVGYTLWLGMRSCCSGRGGRKQCPTSLPSHQRLDTKGESKGRARILGESVDVAARCGMEAGCAVTKAACQGEGFSQFSAV